MPTTATLAEIEQLLKRRDTIRRVSIDREDEEVMKVWRHFQANKTEAQKKAEQIAFELPFAAFATKQ
jgi:hypothetical protein